METEDEQVEKLKQWWRDNGRAVIAGLIIGVGGLYGYRYWDDLQEANAKTASAQFEQMMEALESDNNAVVSEKAERLISDYTDTEYATLARLALARSLAESGEYDQAEAQLQQVVGTIGGEPLGYLARRRLASIQLQSSRLEEALRTLSVEFPPAFSAGVDELKGDIYARQGKAEEAAKEYRKAFKATPGPANAKFLQQKLDDLGVKGEDHA